MLSIGGIAQVGAGVNFQTVETVIVATPETSVPKDSVLALIQWSVYLQVGTATTSLNFIVRRPGVLTGTAIPAIITRTVVAGNFELFSFTYVDRVLGFGTCSWCVTGQGVGSTGNNSVSVATIAAIFLQ